MDDMVGIGNKAKGEVRCENRPANHPWLSMLVRDVDGGYKERAENAERCIGEIDAFCRWKIVVGSHGGSEELEVERQ